MGEAPEMRGWWQDSSGEWHPPEPPPSAEPLAPYRMPLGLRVWLTCLVLAVLGIAAFALWPRGGDAPTALQVTTITEPRPLTHNLFGTFTLHKEWLFTNRPCTGTGGYADIGEGTQVTVKDQFGTVLGTARLGEGTPGGIPAGRTGPAQLCVFTFLVRDLPESAFYQVEVSRRGTQTFSLAEMKQADWSIDLSLG